METRPFQFCIGLLQQGYRFCQACGRTEIQPQQPDYVTRCLPCYRADNPIIFCSCGTEIDKKRRLWAKRKGGIAKRCYLCSKGAVPLCKQCGVVHPTHWNRVLHPA